MRIKVTIANEQSEAVREEVITSAEKVEEEVKGTTDWEAVSSLH
jgi:hypothetical protein